MYVNIDGVQSQYQKIGQGHNLVLLHGWMSDWQVWSPVITTLSETHTLIIPDLPSFGKSEQAPAHWNSQDYATWLNTFLSQVLPSQTFSLAGHSFGGKIAAVYAAKFQHLKNLDKLILLDASGTPDILPFAKKAQQKILQLVPEKLKNAIPYSLKKTLLQKTGSATDHLNSTPSQRRILKNIIGENITQQLTEIKVPTLLLWGGKDSDTPTHHAEKFHQAVAHSQLIIFPNAGHFVFHDEPQKCSSAILNFLQ